jgi:cation diffusion facilitator family transporter
MAQENQDSKKRAAVGKMTGFIGVLCNLLLAGSKLVIGKLAASTSITADGLNNLSDAASSIVTLLGFKLAEKPADKEHPYGHARFEYLASLVVAAMILVIGFELAKTSVLKLIHPASIEFSMLMIIVLIGSILVKLWMMFFYRKMGDKIQSNTLFAAAADSRNDVLTTTAVLAATVVEHISGWKIDGLMGGLVSVFIIVSGISLAKDTISPLLGEGANTGLREQLIGYISSCPLVLGCHDLLVHDYGPGRQYASIHVEIDKKIDPMVCHDEIDRIERECLNRFGVHMVIHYDPVITDDAELDQIRHQVLAILQQIDAEITIHDFRVHTHEGKKELVFDMVVPSEWQGQEKDIIRELTERLQKENKETYLTKITFDLEDRA